MKIRGEGSRNPVDTNKTVQGRYNNRRVEIIVKNAKERKVNLFELKESLEDE